jgi:vacuolar-type H+-ATPase subunit I/STV1
VANRIKGITVEIGGDTTGLEKALKSVNTTIKSTQSALKDVNKLLKLDPSNTELLSQKQTLLKKAIGATKEKLDSLKQAQEQTKQQLENGDLGQDKYDALQREIIETEQELRRLQEEAATTNATLEKMDAIDPFLIALGTVISKTGTALRTFFSNMPVVPIVTTTAETALLWTVGEDTFHKSVSAGTWEFPELELQHGDNTITVTGDGSTSFQYREGRL